MELIVNKKSLLFVMFFLCTQIITAQQRVAPKFIGDPLYAHWCDSSNHELFFDKLVPTFNNFFYKQIQANCYYGLGVFTFVINQDSSVKVKSFYGKLPQFLVDSLKKNIESTKGMWTLEKRYDYTPHSYPFILYVMVDYSSHACEFDLEKQPPENLDVRVGFDLANAFKPDSNKIIELPEGYLLPVLWFKSIE